jgi:hypothetical protein
MRLFRISILAVVATFLLSAAIYQYLSRHTDDASNTPIKVVVTRVEKISIAQTMPTEVGSTTQAELITDPAEIKKFASTQPLLRSTQWYKSLDQ